jgi:glycosyltransferase involved in cell wall biosynthesis
MKATVIINTNNQNAFLRRAILSAINQKYSNYEVIVSNLSKKKDPNIENEFKNNEKIKFINLNEKFLNPTQNQLYAIKEALKYSNGKYIFLLDGDDYFKKDKINKIFNLIKNEEKFLMDKPIIFDEITKKYLKKMRVKSLKKNILYKILVNNWPSITCTSAITVEKNIIKKFFNENNPFKYKHLAIDIQLATFANSKFNIKYLDEDLTFKSQNKKNLDKTYSNLLSVKFWIRRNEQHDFFINEIKKDKLFKGFDFYIVRIINFFIKNYFFFLKKKLFK